MTSGGAPAGIWQRAYFAAARLITLTADGDRPAPRSGRWATTIAAANGFILVSLVITYLLPIVTAQF